MVLKGPKRSPSRIAALGADGTLPEPRLVLTLRATHPSFRRWFPRAYYAQAVVRARGAQGGGVTQGTPFI